jgi:hypothetical protein
MSTQKFEVQEAVAAAATKGAAFKRLVQSGADLKKRRPRLCFASSKMASILASSRALPACHVPSSLAEAATREHHFPEVERKT